MITLSRATRKFRSGDVVTTAISEVDLQIGAGEFCAIMGPSGCGKTTLLSIIGLLDGLTEGTHYFQDQDVTSLSEHDLALLRRDHIGFIFQNFNLIDGQSVWKNVALPLGTSIFNRRDVKQKAHNALALVGLEHRANHLPKQLSGGQQQRVAIARAIVSNPDLIIADEPTGNLDTENGDRILSLLTEIHSLGKTIVMVTHAVRDAERASRQIQMLDGKIL